MAERKEVTFQIVEHLAVINEQSNGWQKELNIVSWNDGPGKYDLRDWDEEHARMSKGITLKEEEAKMVAEAILAHINKK